MPDKPQAAPMTRRHHFSPAQSVCLVSEVLIFTLVGLWYLEPVVFTLGLPASVMLFILSNEVNTRWPYEVVHYVVLATRAWKAYTFYHLMQGLRFEGFIMAVATTLSVLARME